VIKPLRWYYYAGTVAAIILAGITVLPAPASKPFLLRYYAHCSWTPISTIICLAISAVIYRLGRMSSR
jgi:hypothetical protein